MTFSTEDQYVGIRKLIKKFSYSCGSWKTETKFCKLILIYGFMLETPVDILKTDTHWVHLWKLWFRMPGESPGVSIFKAPFLILIYSLDFYNG